MALRHRVFELKQSAFARAVGVLVGGTAFAHLLTALALPILTRLYSPQDFNLLAVLSGLITVLAVSACFRFDAAIPIPERDQDAANLLALSLLLCASVSAVIAVVVLVGAEAISAAMKQPALAPYLWLVPLGVLLTSSFGALQLWMVRRKHFAPIARIRIGQSAVGAGTQIGMGWLGLAPIGLLLGQVLVVGAGALGLGWRVLTRDRAALQELNTTRMRELALRYSRFPKFSALEGLFNTIGMQLPMIVIAAVALGPEAGYLILAMSVMQAPMGLIGTAVAQVYFSRAPEEHRAGNLGAFTAKVFGALVSAGTGPLLFAGIVAPHAFALVFGEEWRRAGELVRWMTPWFMVQFLAVPVSMALHITDHQRLAMLLQLGGLLIRTGLVLAAARIAGAYMAEAYAISGFIFYGLYLLVVMRVAATSLRSLWHESIAGVWITLAWIALGLVCHWVLTLRPFLDRI